MKDALKLKSSDASFGEQSDQLIDQVRGLIRDGANAAEITYVKENGKRLLAIEILLPEETPEPVKAEKPPTKSAKESKAGK